MILSVIKLNLFLFLIITKFEILEVIYFSFGLTLSFLKEAKVKKKNHKKENQGS